MHKKSRRNRRERKRWELEKEREVEKRKRGARKEGRRWEKGKEERGEKKKKKKNMGSNIIYKRTGNALKTGRREVEQSEATWAWHKGEILLTW